MNKPRNKKSPDEQKKSVSAFLDQLNSEEHAAVLRRILEIHPELSDEADIIAKSVLAQVKFEDLAREVEETLKDADLDELNSRAGRHEWGYVEPSEAAWEILEEAVAPFIRDMRRRIDLGLEDGALEICNGIVLGLYRTAHNQPSQVVAWAPDFPAEAACNAIDAWLSGDNQMRSPSAHGDQRSRKTFPSEFVEQSIPQWTGLVTRVISRDQNDRIS